MHPTFEDLGLNAITLETIAKLGYTNPTPIQTQAIPVLLQGRDVMGQAQTGTGKTAAYTLPFLQDLSGDGVQALILTPTRELANQVAQAVHRYGGTQGIRVLPIYGGQSYDRQIRRLEKGVQVVVGTPGRTLDLIQKKALNIRNVRYLILDEADEMLNMGFIEDVEAILEATNADTRQTILFSATSNRTIERLAQRHMREPEHIVIESETLTGENTRQRYFVVNHHDKVAALSRIFEVENPQNTLVFTRTKVGSNELAETLLTYGYAVAALHGDLPQVERERVLNRFRDGQLSILIATDVIGRGVDIPEVSHVINFDVPQRPVEYVHRIGRTGRAGRSGEAITLITTRQRRDIKQIEQYTRQTIERGQLPTREDVVRHRQERFMIQVSQQLEAGVSENELDVLHALMNSGYSPYEIAATSLKMLQAEQSSAPLEELSQVHFEADTGRASAGGRRSRRSRNSSEGKQSSHEAGMVRLHMNIGKKNGIRPGDVVYNIASAAQIPGKSIGAIDIQLNDTYLDVPEGYVDAVLQNMKTGKVRGRAIKLTRA